MERRIRERAHAKVNLRLRVLGREASGYHALETLFLRLGLHDDVELSPGGEGIRLALEGPETEGVPEGPENLCWRAAERFFHAADPGESSGGGGTAGGRGGVSIRLRKRVPPGTGLGGGSADAAAVLRGLNAHHEAPLAPRELIRVAGELGADVPFALAGDAMALGWERGRRLLPLPAPPPLPALVLLPPLRIATRDAYGWLAEDRGSAAAAGPAARLPPLDRLAGWDALLRIARNDFEGVVFRRHPELERLRRDLEAAGASLALLSGSGSALFGLFEKVEARDEAARTFEGRAGVRTLPARAPG